MKIIRELGQFLFGTSPDMRLKTKAVIDKYGDLYIDKNGRGLVAQRCIHKDMDPQGVTDHCNHNCPHFEEPEAGITEPTNAHMGPGGMRRCVTLDICHGKVLEFDELDDQRGKE